LDLHKRFGIKVKPGRFKIRIMERMAEERADEWILIESILRSALELQ
jgi:hypothetical protein